MTTDEKRAYVTMTTNDLFVPGVITVIKSLRIVKSAYPIYCMVSEEVSEDNREKIESLGCKVLEVPKIHSSTSGEEGDRFEIGKNWLTFTKLNVFSLTQFDKIVYLDADCMVLQNIDDMFYFDSLSGYVLAHTGELEAGVLVLEPSEKSFNDLMTHKDKENWTNHDQTLIDWYFRRKNRRFTELPNQYHYCHKIYHNKDPHLIQRGEAKIIEFNGYKPWIPDRWKDGEDWFYKVWMSIYNYIPVIQNE